ncbi:uncharacterized protein LOC124242584 [Equus quagga]|uniref:uncharacterized protein LOC124242584 n=1 Tax=Equus quagga TaxID=89248 RepID=UPI001EE2CB64|nr:uncharacterized protein LOC124242584 [Equus quagga]
MSGFSSRMKHLEQQFHKTGLQGPPQMDFVPSSGRSVCLRTPLQHTDPCQLDMASPSTPVCPRTGLGRPAHCWLWVNSDFKAQLRNGCPGEHPSTPPGRAGAPGCDSLVRLSCSSRSSRSATQSREDTTEPHLNVSVIRGPLLQRLPVPGTPQFSPASLRPLHAALLVERPPAPPLRIRSHQHLPRSSRPTFQDPFLLLHQVRAPALPIRTGGPHACLPARSE